MAKIIEGANYANAVLEKYLASETFKDFKGDINIKYQCHNGGIAGMKVNIEMDFPIPKKNKVKKNS